MVEVNLWSGLRSYTDGNRSVEVEAKNVGEVLSALAQAYPGLSDFLEDSVSVSVDGKIIADDMTEPVSPESEIWLMRRMRGG